MKCTGDNACVWPASELTGLCKLHERDLVADRSDMGSTLVLVEQSGLGYGARIHKGTTQKRSNNGRFTDY